MRYNNFKKKIKNLKHTIEIFINHKYFNYDCQENIYITISIFIIKY